jgi:ketosteroid isomerase-like protein
LRKETSRKDDAMVALRLPLLGFALLALAGCQPKTAGVGTPIDLAREQDAIRGSDRVSEMNDRDLDQASAYFAPTAVVAWPGAEAMHGSAQIRAALAETFKDPAFKVDWRPGPIGVSKEGDLAWASGGYSVTRTDPQTHKPVTLKGPFVETFAKSPDGHWLITSGVSGAVSAPPPE